MYATKISLLTTQEYKRNMNYKKKITEHYVIKFSEYLHYLISFKTHIPNGCFITQLIKRGKQNDTIKYVSVFRFISGLLTREWGWKFRYALDTSSSLQIFHHHNLLLIFILLIEDVGGPWRTEKYSCLKIGRILENLLNVQPWFIVFACSRLKFLFITNSIIHNDH